MTDEVIDGEAAGEEETIAEETVVETDDIDPVDPEIETRALEMGWVPKDKFKGDPDKWTPADEYVRRGEEILPIARAENKRLREKLAKIEKATEEKLSRIEKMGTKALARQRADLEAKYEDLKRQAVVQGDEKAYDAASKGQREAMKAFDEEADEKPTTGAKTDTGQPLSAEDQASVDRWVKSNTWFNEDRVLNAAANEAFEEVETEMPAASMAEKMAEVGKRVRETFPDLRGRAPRRSTAARVEGGNGRGFDGGSNGVGKLWAKVPADARQIADQHIKEEGLYLGKGEDKSTLTAKQLAAARERWAEQYLAD